MDDCDAIDELLDEVEGVLDKHSKKSRRFGNNCKETVKPIKTASKFNSKFSDELDDILSDVTIDNHGDADRNSLTVGKVDRIVTSAQKKCYPVYIGGAATVIGLSSSVSRKACDRLRCTDCDFKILTFDNMAWDASTSYLFLRNNMPDARKLGAKLKESAGIRAYACQCKFKNVGEFQDLSKDSELKWVCGKHQDSK